MNQQKTQIIRTSDCSSERGEQSCDRQIGNEKKEEKNASRSPLVNEVIEIRQFIQNFRKSVSAGERDGIFWANPATVLEKKDTETKNENGKNKVSRDDIDDSSIEKNGVENTEALYERDSTDGITTRSYRLRPL